MATKELDKESSIGLGMREMRSGADNIVRGVGAGVEARVVAPIVGAASRIGQGVSATASNLKEGIVAGARVLGTAGAGKVTTVRNKASDVGNGAIAKAVDVKKGIVADAEDLVAAGADKVTNVRDKVLDIGHGAIDAAVGVEEGIVTGARVLGAAAVGTVSYIGRGLSSAASKVYDEGAKVKGAVTAKVDDVLDPEKPIGAGVREVASGASHIVKGVEEGIVAKGQKTTESFKKAAQGLVGVASGTASYIGRGLNGAASKVCDAGAKVKSAVTDKVDEVLDPDTPIGLGMREMGSGASHIATGVGRGIVRSGLGALRALSAIVPQGVLEASPPTKKGAPVETKKMDGPA